jgi:peptidoglycan hydrolase CwlO-like protein
VTGPVGEPPLDALPPDAPATVEDVRASRRWTIVALVWAIAASAIAIIALVNANNNDNATADNQPTQTSQTVSPQELDAFKKETNDRLDAFSRRLNNTAAEADVQKLDKRLTQTENDISKMQSDAGKQTDAITQLQSDVKDLQQRVDDLESKQQNQGQDQSTTP